MKLVKTIALFALLFWLVQLLFFTLLFASSFTHVIVRLFIALALPVNETSFHACLSTLLKGITFPVRLFLPKNWEGANVLGIILLLALNSVIWSGVFGIIISVVTRIRTNCLRR
jgi:hypothetical protein